MADRPATAPAKQLSLLGFFAITASMVMAVYEYPTFATSGFSLVFFLLAGGLLWFIPVALCAAEMATVEVWEEGGVFAWVSNTLGERWGFAAISFTYLEIAIGFLPMLYFVLGSLSYILDWPALNHDPVVKTIAGLIILWGLAVTQLGGTKYTAQIAKFGFFGGILVPALILVALAILYLSSGQPIAIEMSAKTFFPDFTKLGTMVVFVAFILSYMGVEASATHVNEMANPGRDYPLAMFILMIVAIGLSSIGGLAVAAVVPLQDINLSAGVIQTFETLILHYGGRPRMGGPHRGGAADARCPRRDRRLDRRALARHVRHGSARHPAEGGCEGEPQRRAGGVPASHHHGGADRVHQHRQRREYVVPHRHGADGGPLPDHLLPSVHRLHRAGTEAQGQEALLPGSRRGRLQDPAGVRRLPRVGVRLRISFVPPSSLPGASDESYVTLLVVSFLFVFAIPFVIYALHNKHGKSLDHDLVPIRTHNAPEGHFFIHPRARATHHLVPATTRRPKP
jgi:Amino acid transporters